MHKVRDSIDRTVTRINIIRDIGPIVLAFIGGVLVMVPTIYFLHDTQKVLSCYVEEK